MSKEKMDEVLMIDEVLEAEDEQEEATKRFFEYKGRQWHLGFNIKRIQMAEQMTKTSAMVAITVNNGMMGIQELMIYFAVGLCDEQGKYIDIKKGIKLAEKLIQEEGYLAMDMLVVEALQRDCGFLFRTA